jgi:hypothetical protein
LIVNTPSGHESRADEVQIRATAIAQVISHVTSNQTAKNDLTALEDRGSLLR